MNTADVLEIAITIARAGGAVAHDYFRKPIAMATKSTNIDIVTEADKAVEKVIANHILKQFPDHHLMGEEGGGQGAPAESAQYFWYVDPIDGTTNFANGIPYFSVSICMADTDCNPLVGVIYDVTRDDVYSAIAGQGATYNGEPIQVSSKDTLIESVLVTGFPADRATNPDNNLKEYGNFAIRTRSARCLGSAALDLAYVASGRVDGFWERGINLWDVMAGILLVQEAGGIVTDYEGNEKPQLNPAKRYLASNGHLHSAMIEILKL